MLTPHADFSQISIVPRIPEIAVEIQPFPADNRFCSRQHCNPRRGQGHQNYYFFIQNKPNYQTNGIHLALIQHKSRNAQSFGPLSSFKFFGGLTMTCSAIYCSMQPKGEKVTFDFWFSVIPNPCFGKIWMPFLVWFSFDLLLDTVVYPPPSQPACFGCMLAERRVLCQVPWSQQCYYLCGIMWNECQMRFWMQIVPKK